MSVAARGYWIRLMTSAVAASGFAVIAIVFVYYQAWADLLVWDRVGDEIRAGISPYYATPIGVGFYYAPPWALGLALLTWMPPVVIHLLITAAEIVALRYLTGSWRWSGLICWTIPMWREVQVGQVNVLLAAAIALAVRGDPRAAVVMSAAKISPVLAIHPRDWRPALAVALGLVLVTLPWLSLWGDWVQQLLTSYGTTIAPANVQLTFAFPLQLAVAALLLLARRPWARAAAAIVALPTIYWPLSLLVLLALVPILRDRQSRGVASSRPALAPEGRG
jgi:hypothetical protein